MMKFAFLSSYREIAPLVDGPFNDPAEADDFDEEVFAQEYEQVRSGLIALIDRHCKAAGISPDDIHVGHRTGPSRGIGLVIEERASSQLLPFTEQTQAYLKSLPVAYCVPINLVLDEAGDFKDLYIAITNSDTVYVHADKRQWLREAGISC